MPDIRLTAIPKPPAALAKRLDVLLLDDRVCRLSIARRPRQYLQPTQKHLAPDLRTTAGRLPALFAVSGTHCAGSSVGEGRSRHASVPETRVNFGTQIDRDVNSSKKPFVPCEDLPSVHPCYNPDPSPDVMTCCTIRCTHYTPVYLLRHSQQVYRHVRSKQSFGRTRNKQPCCVCAKPSSSGFSTFRYPA